MNALDLVFWEEIKLCFEMIKQDVDTRAVLLSGAGHLFCSGLDLKTALSIFSSDAVTRFLFTDVARRALKIRNFGKMWQDAFTSIEMCGKPVIACLHGAVLGAGLELVAACDIRFCTSDASFKLAEVDIGLASDVGGLQRLPKIIGNQTLGSLMPWDCGLKLKPDLYVGSLVRELALSGRQMLGSEAFQHGLVSRIFDTKEAMMSEGLALCQSIASKSPIATLGIKEFLNYTRDNSVKDSLEYAITWNMSMLQGSDLAIATASMVQKSLPEYENLPGAKQSKL
ncbi:4)-dienoyl-CoA isomerase [Durusdinium trenchii]|uniref:Mitochondrial n=1 Tax=Durusdinium trenchii TaxID=1381693 RepID=A0ABP0QTV5_9DINO